MMKYYKYSNTHETLVLHLYIKINLSTVPTYIYI